MSSALRRTLVCYSPFSSTSAIVPPAQIIHNYFGTAGRKQQCVLPPEPAASASDQRYPPVIAEKRHRRLSSVQWRTRAVQDVKF